MKNAAKRLPLFESAKRQALKTLCVRRFEAGRWVCAPQSFEGDELADREAVRARFGGGRYEVIARDGRQIVGRTRFVLDGASRPLRDEPPPAALSQGVGDDVLRAFATAAGERYALVFRLLNQGLDVVEIVDRTGLEPQVVRGIFEEWMTPFAVARDKIEARVRELAKKEHVSLEREWELAWLH